MVTAVAISGYLKTHCRAAEDAERGTKVTRTISATLHLGGFEINSNTTVALVENGLTLILTFSLMGEGWGEGENWKLRL
jgi:hypothetical protein